MATVEIIRESAGFWSGRRFAWAGGAALIGCAVSCALPLLAVVGGGGVLTSAAALVRPGSELIVGGFAFAAALGVMAWRHRRRMRNAAACGCASKSSATRLFESPEPSSDEPVACTADLRDKPAVQQQVDGYRAAFAHLLATERFDGGFRWRFRHAPGLEVQLAQLMTREHDCCRFFQFTLSRQDDELAWETRAKAHAASVLEEFSRLPERLQAEQRRVHDVAALKTSARASGLRFVADEGSDQLNADRGR